MNKWESSPNALLPIAVSRTLHRIQTFVGVEVKLPPRTVAPSTSAEPISTRFFTIYWPSMVNP